MSSSTKILVGLVSGVLVGLFFGEHAGALKVVADGFVKLLQMMGLPYITISIITSLGTLRCDQLKTLGVRAGAVLIGLWCLAPDLALPEVHGCRARTGDRQDSAGLSRGQARSRVGAVRQYLDRVEAERRYHRRALRPLGSGEASGQAPAALVDRSQRAALGGVIASTILPPSKR